YFALKLTGHDPESEYMLRARRAIRAAGGADAVNSFTRFYLALLGQISYDHCPAVPPELVLLPNWSPVNIYRMSAWSRTIVVPLSIMWAHRPARSLAPECGIRELFLKEPTHWPQLRCPGLSQEHGWFSWDRFFRRMDSGIKWLEKRRWRPLRKRALAAATEWMTSRFAHSDGLGAIFPPIIWSVIALKCLGYEDDSAEVRYNHEQLRALVIEEKFTSRVQPCLSPVWDTAIALRALAVAGHTLDSEPAAKAVNWLLEKEVTRSGDWANRVSASPGGWYFEHHNEFYPDVDDTAMVLIALAEVQELGDRGQESGDRSQVFSNLKSQISNPNSQVPNPNSEITSASSRALRWMLAMQNRDGGWGAFDKDNDSEFLCRVPFADHNAMIDPSTPDLTGRVLESLALWGGSSQDAASQKALRFLRQTQEADGSWYGRWGVNYIYGTWQALVGLAAMQVPKDDPAMQKGANWLLAHQQACGGWGESADSYEAPELRGQCPVTASQSAWAILGLMAAGLARHPAVERGLHYLLDTQRPDGAWDELEFTGTGFPRVFYLKYHLYRVYFPLLALATWERQIRNSKSEIRISSLEFQI
ncbi:MAG: squalene--hopene cyclase, partial [Pirellulaceae bacterium]|nr:squalene--hopene cyclase [Pirellulaceae bacterium]